MTTNNKLHPSLLQTTQSVWSAESPLSVTSLWEKNGPRTCRRPAGQSCVTLIVSCVMSTTMATAALSSVGHETMPLDTSPVASGERSYATLAGRDSTALNVSGAWFLIHHHVSGDWTLNMWKGHRQGITGTKKTVLHLSRIPLVNIWIH